MTHVAEPPTISVDTRWDVQGGFLISPTGRKVCRIGEYGILWFWDKGLKRELPFTLAMMRWAWEKVQKQG